MKIELKKISLENFKGIKELTVDFKKVTEIYGANATGKTTIVDAFRWLLFGKDSSDRSDFNIKTLGKNGNAIHGLEHSVEAEIDIDGKVKTFKKVFKEKWQKKRGSVDPTFTGHETLFYLDEVPFKKVEYQAELAKLIDEKLFKIVTDPFYFAEKISWQNRRETLLNISGEVDDESVIASNKDFRELDLENGVEHLRKSLSARRKKLNNDIKSIPIRIDEAQKSIRKDIDFKVVESELSEFSKELEDINKYLDVPTSETPKLKEKRLEIAQIELKIRSIEEKAEDEHLTKVSDQKGIIAGVRDEISEVETQELSLERKLTKIAEDREYFNEQIISYRNAWDATYAEKFDTKVATECPTCKRAFESSFIEEKRAELLENFNKEKADRLSEIRAKGIDAKGKLENANKELEEVNNEIVEMKAKIKKLYDKLKVEDNKLVELKNNKITPEEITELKEKQDRIGKEVDELLLANQDNKAETFKARRIELLSKIDDLKVQLTYKGLNKTQEERIKNLLKDERALAKQIAEIEKQQFLAEDFVRVKFELLENKVNQQFKYVQFKLFDSQINGGIVDVCEVLVNGVPFKDCNTGKKYNAGLDVINTLSNHYNIQTPIFIDNAEAISQWFVESGSQLIKLFVDEEYKELKIVHLNKIKEVV